MEKFNFAKGTKPHPKVVKHGKEWAHGVEHHSSTGGHSVQAAGGDEMTAYHHIDHNGEHRGMYTHYHDDETPSKSEIKKQLPHAPSHAHNLIHKDIKDNSGYDEDYTPSQSQDSLQEHYADYISNQIKNYIYEEISYHNNGYMQKLNNKSNHSVDYDTDAGGHHTANHGGKPMEHFNDEEHYHEDNRHDRESILHDVKMNHPNHSPEHHKAFTNDIIKAEKAHRKAHPDHY